MWEGGGTFLLGTLFGGLIGIFLGAFVLVKFIWLELWNVVIATVSEVEMFIKTTVLISEVWWDGRQYIC